MHTFSAVFVTLLALATGLQLYLARRHLRHVQRHRERVPEAFSDRIDAPSHRRAADYTITRTRFGMAETLYSAALLLFWTLGGGLDGLDRLWRTFDPGPIATGTGFLLSAFLAMAVLDLPFGVYGTFVIEQRFGFNRTRAATYAVDLLKQALLLLALGGPLAALVLWLMTNAGPLWWLYVWAVWMGISLLMLWAYPAFIAPLFNRFTPLADAQLVQRIEQLLQRCGFASKGVFVMDGSRRSSHGNAYFSGLGNNKRIVFFDTLLEKLDADEIEAVLAHELGHFRRRHIRKRLVTLATLSLAGLALLGWLSEQPWFYAGLGIATPSTHAALILFLLVSPLLTLFLQPLLAATLRRHEFEADDFAAEHADARHLVRALVKLYQENAATLTPDPVYSAFHDTHPPAPIRIAHLTSKLTMEGTP